MTTTTRFLISREQADQLCGARGNTELMNNVLGAILLAAGDREVACPDESRLPTGALRLAGFIMMKPDDFYAAARAARAERQANRPRTARQQLAIPGRTFPEAIVAILTRQPLPGKTARDRASGALARRAANLAARAAESRDRAKKVV